MEFLTALKLLSESGNAESIKDLNQRVQLLAALGEMQLTWWFVSTTITSILILALAWLFFFSHRKLEKKVKKLTALVEKAAGVAIVE